MLPNTDGDHPWPPHPVRPRGAPHDGGRGISTDDPGSALPDTLAETGLRAAGLAETVRASAATTTSSDPPRPARPSPEARSLRSSATASAEFHELRFHAAGALGEVFTAREVELNREVALKFIRPGRSHDADSRRRFLLEAEFTGRLEHPGVVPIYAPGTDADGAHCYAMRFVRGETLQEAIDAFHAAERDGRDASEQGLALRERLGRFVSVCRTMAYAHSRGILHRDLKPRNIMLGKFGATLVVDWCLAKPFDRDEATLWIDEEPLTPGSGSGEAGSGTPTVGAVGTPSYMSPEQAGARWDEVGPASDLFGLGAILYPILAGRTPFQARRIEELLEKVKWCDFPGPRRVRPRVPRPLEAISLKAMARRPGDRYETAQDLAADVRRWLADELVAAYPEPPAARARRWMLNKIGSLLDDLVQTDEAMATYHRSRANLEQLVRENAAIPVYRFALGGAIHDMGVIEIGRCHWHQAREWLLQAVASYRQALAALSKNPRYLASLRRALRSLIKVRAALDQTPESIRAAQEGASVARGDPSVLYNIACDLSLSVPLARGWAHEVLADEAIAALRRAIAAGWVDAALTGRGRDLDPLRDRNDFRRLLADLFDRGFPDDPFAKQAWSHDEAE